MKERAETRVKASARGRIQYEIEELTGADEFLCVDEFSDTDEIISIVGGLARALAVDRDEAVCRFDLRREVLAELLRRRGHPPADAEDLAALVCMDKAPKADDAWCFAPQPRNLGVGHAQLRHG